MGIEDPNAAQEPSRIVVADDHPLLGPPSGRPSRCNPTSRWSRKRQTAERRLSFAADLRPESGPDGPRMPVMDGLGPPAP